ncbi:hypothetical protein HOLleu_26382 [Holothuria leucospilota]|uniref:Uncharacterized protein n=1 Tax=Holothuria leucospilota TaxID=206669 RepID=A0A9Q1BNU1_HOLLE|nr:hypothetical protein HOLleu_26382 [Holothuria leucospilota]
MACTSPPTFSYPVEFKCSHRAVNVLCEEYAHLGEDLDKCREERSECYKKLQTVIEEAYGHLCKKDTKDENLNDALTEHFGSANAVFRDFPA